MSDSQRQPTTVTETEDAGLLDQVLAATRQTAPDEAKDLAACRTYAHRRFMLESQRRSAPSPDAANEQLPPHRSPNRLPDAAVYR